MFSESAGVKSARTGRHLQVPAAAQVVVNSVSKSRRRAAPHSAVRGAIMKPDINAAFAPMSMTAPLEQDKMTRH
jgi:hypothetical protein